MNSPSDDTQPRSPFHNPAPLQPTVSPEGGEMRGPGCLVWSIAGGSVLIFGVVIVILASLAGWNSGLRVARSNATATRDFDVQVQCDHLPGDIASGNTGLVQRRLEYLLEQTPLPACLPPIIPTATALYLTSQPTMTPTPSPTVEVAPTIEVTAETVVEPEDSGRFDPAKLLADARDAIALGQWKEAVETLDAVNAIDPAYEANTVNNLLLLALKAQADRAFKSGILAEGIALTNRAEEYGDIGELNYERFIATLYLDAQRYAGINYAESIRLLRIIVVEQGLTTYQGGAPSQLLAGQYIAYADALAVSDPCQAVIQYENAISFRASNPQAFVNGGDLTAKRDTAQTACLQLTALPNITPQPGETSQPVAPIGVVGTPGG